MFNKSIDEKINTKTILITGGNGFIGKNLYYYLNENSSELNINKIFIADTNTTNEELSNMVISSDFIFNLAGINRPKNENEFIEVNVSYLEKIINILENKNKKTSIMLSSSSQSLLNNSYGISKKQAENLLIKYNKKTNTDKSQRNNIR